MLFYGKHKIHGSGKIHPADECGICSENNKNTKGGRRQHDKRDLNALIEEYDDDNKGRERQERP